MFPSNAFQIQSADLVSAGAALLRHNSALEMLKSSIVSGQAKEKYCTSSSPVPAPLLQLFQLVQKGQMTVNVSSQPAPQAGALLRLQGLETGGQNQRTSLGAPQCWFGEKQEEGRAIGPSCCWTQKKGGMSHGQKALLALEAGPCHTQVLSWMPSHRLSGTRSCPCLPWAEHLGRDLFPPSFCPGTAPAMGLQRAPEVTNSTKA